MTQLKFKVKVEKDLSRQVVNQVRTETRKAVRTIAQDLARTSSEATPHLSGDLSASYAIAYSMGSEEIKATVEFSVFNGGFNYAVAMHEWTYNLGEGSQRKGGGTGMSGTNYPVGNKFLTRVVDGEEQAYRNYIGEKIQGVLRGG